MVNKEKLNSLLKIFHIPTWMVILLAAVIILRIPTFFEPYSYGDEMIYLTLGEGIRQGIPLYSGLHDNKPPLLYIFAAVAGRLFWFKAILFFWNLATILLFWKLAQALFPKKESLHKIATIIFAVLTTLPLLEGNIVNAEMFMIGTTISAFFILFTKKHTVRNLLLSGVLLGLSALFKIPAVFELPVILIYWLITNGFKPDKLKATFGNFFTIAFGFLLPIGFTLVWYFLRGASADYVYAAFLQNIGYLSTWRPSDQELSFWVKNLPLLIRGLIVLIGCAILYWKRKFLPKHFIFITVWLLLALFGVTLSERPYPHYLVQALPAICYLFGILFTDKSLTQSIAIVPLALAFFVPFYYKFWYYPTTTYYLKFIKLTTRQISKDNYFATFNANTSRNYRIARLINTVTDKKDKVFVWGDTSTIYALSRRLPPIKWVADYHIKDFSNDDEVYNILKSNPPKIIVYTDEAESFPKLIKLIDQMYTLLANIDGAEIWRLTTPAVKSAHFP